MGSISCCTSGRFQTISDITDFLDREDDIINNHLNDIKLKLMNNKQQDLSKLIALDTSLKNVKTCFLELEQFLLKVDNYYINKSNKKEYFEIINEVQDKVLEHYHILKNENFSNLVLI